MLKFQKNSKVLVVVAHPDDEVIGLGGTINKMTVEYNCDARCIILGEGITSRGNKRDIKNWEKELVTHRHNIKQASKFIGYNKTKAFDFPDNRFDSVDLLDFVKVIEKEKNEFKPGNEIVHVHEGSIGQLCNEEIFQKWKMIMDRFPFGKIDEKYKQLTHL